MLKKRTVVTTLSITAIVLAGAAAVAANVGILTAADNTPMGTLSAEADLATVAPPSSTSSAPATTPGGTPQRFAVENSGQVEVLTEGGKLSLGDVTPSPGWQARPGSVTPDSAEVTFSSQADRLVFTATMAGDGTVTGSAKRPGQSTEPIPQGTAASPTNDGRDDDHADAGHDDADHDDGDHDKSDHEDKQDDHEDKDHDHDGGDDDD